MSDEAKLTERQKDVLVLLYDCGALNGAEVGQEVFPYSQPRSHQIAGGVLNRLVKVGLCQHFWRHIRGWQYDLTAEGELLARELYEARQCR